MSQVNPFVIGLKCRVCGKQYPSEPLNFCTDDFGPLEVNYDYESIGEALSREKIESRPRNMWRYAELLPLDGPPTVGFHAGGTPLVRADRLAEEVLRHGQKDVTYIADREQLPEHLAGIVKEGDIVITLGAGNIWQQGEALVKLLGGTL